MHLLFLRYGVIKNNGEGFWVALDRLENNIRKLNVVDVWSILMLYKNKTAVIKWFRINDLIVSLANKCIDTLKVMENNFCGMTVCRCHIFLQNLVQDFLIDQVYLQLRWEQTVLLDRYC